MLSKAEDLLRSLLSGKHIGPQDHEGPLNQELFYCKIGFTIYRTDYSPGSDELWTKLQTVIKSDLTRAVNAVTPKNADANSPNERETKALEHLASLVCVDGRSDAAALKGRTVEELRAIYKRSEAEGSKPRGEGDGNGSVEDKPLPLNHQSAAFLWADAEVLRSLSEEMPFVKIAKVDYDVNDWPSPNGQEYWGVMRLRIDTIWYMWEELQLQIFDDIAPPMDRDAEFLPVLGQDGAEMVSREGREFI